MAKCNQLTSLPFKGLKEKCVEIVMCHCYIIVYVTVCIWHCLSVCLSVCVDCVMKQAYSQLKKTKYICQRRLLFATISAALRLISAIHRRLSTTSIYLSSLYNSWTEHVKNSNNIIAGENSAHADWLAYACRGVQHREKWRTFRHWNFRGGGVGWNSV